jgi:putative ABC transport system permease protein
MILVMLSSTSALYTGSEECLDARYPNDIGAFACKYGYDEGVSDLSDRLENVLESVSEAHGAEVTNKVTYSTYSISGYLENSKLQIKLNSMTDMAFIDYDKIAQIQFLDKEVYNSVFGNDIDLNPGEVLVGTSKHVEIGDVFTIGETEFNVVGRIDDKIGDIDKTVESAASPTVFVIVNDVDSVAQQYIQYKDYDGEDMLAWFWYCRFDTGLDADGQVALAEELDTAFRDELDGFGFSNFYAESHEAERDDFVGTFGGLFFLGIMLSMIFLLSCVIIIYYKQVSEGFEDRANFEIMQKVGMTKREIRDSINSQMFTVFMIPIILAVVHLLVVLPIVNKLLMLFGLFNFPRLLITSGVCVLLCGVFYGVIYKITSNAYYRIVSD